MLRSCNLLPPSSGINCHLLIKNEQKQSYRIAQTDTRKTHKKNNSTWTLRANFALRNFLLRSNSRVWLHQHLKMILEEVKLAREFHWGNLTDTVSISGCWKIILQINYILEKINIPQTSKKTSLILMNGGHFPSFCRHTPARGNQYSLLNAQGAHTAGAGCAGAVGSLSLSSKGRS